MPRYFVVLDDINGDIIKQFDELSITDPEKIRQKFREKEPPVILYEEGDRMKGKIVGQDIFKPGPVIYLWSVKKEAWEEPELLQNALFCSTAVYEKNPFQYLKGTGDKSKNFHTVNHVIAVGEYKSDEGTSQRCLLALAENPETKESMLIAAFKGTQDTEDWLTNLTLSQEADERFRGKFHGGFLKRGNCINIGDILFCAEYYEATKILTCGHSLGGAVSTIVHMNLLDKGSEQVEKKNIINVTFGAPFVGNEALEKHANQNELSRNMFHLAAATDVVPGLLSLGHTVRVIKEEAERSLSSLTSGLSEILKHQLMRFLKRNQAALNTCASLIEAYCSQDDGKRDLFASIVHVNRSIESTLQNGYRESNFVPIGKTVLLAAGRSAEMLDQGAKIKERILQSALEHHTKLKSKQDIMDEHSMKNYKRMVKEELKGFKTFSYQRIQINKVPLEHKFDREQFEFEGLCHFRCAYGGCQEADARIPLYDQTEGHKQVIFCRTCQENPNKEEYFFHEACAAEQCKSQDHIVMLLPNNKVQVFEASYKKGAFQDYPETWWVALVTNISAVGTKLGLSIEEMVAVVATTSKRASVATEAVDATVANLGPKCGLKSVANEANMVLAIASFGIKFTASSVLWWTNRISLKDYIVQSMGHAAEALGGYGGSLVGAEVGAAAGSVGGPVGIAFGLFFGGLAGGIVGSVLGRMSVDWLDQKWTASCEEEGKVNAIVEAMVVLDMKNIDQLTVSEEVYRCFRRQTLLKHPDKLPQSASAKEREDANKNFVILVMARDLLIQVVDYPTDFSQSLKEKVQKKLRGATQNIGVLNLIKIMKERQEEGRERAIEYHKMKAM